jgi:hypothetical protein
MKKYAGGLAVLALATAGCGSSSNGGTGTTNTAVSQATSKAETVLKRCLPMKNGIPDPLELTSSTARTAFVNCAVPPAQRAAFKQCVINVALGGLPTKSRLESGIDGCLTKAGV